MTDLTSEEVAELLRKRNRYRELILSGKLVLPHDRAVQLLGPDCLYHLYALEDSRPHRRKRRSTK